MATTMTPDTIVRPSIIEDLDTDTPWTVVAIDDPINTIPYVILTLQKIFGFSLEEATNKTMEIHNDGRSALWAGARTQAENYRNRVLAAQISCKVEQI